MTRYLLTFIAFLAAFSAHSAEAMLKQMNGVWRSADLTIILDTDRMLGSTQPNKPFQRDPLRIRNITGQIVMFEIGSQSFIGLFNGTSLNLTGGSVSGTITLNLAAQ